jgi:hypothetical protein
MKIKITIVLVVVMLTLSLYIGNETWKQVKNSSDQKESVTLPFDSVSNHLLAVACMDCHSNHTKVPLYARFFPISSYTARHVEEGRKELNLGDWDKLRSADRFNACKAMIREVRKKKMPLPDYALLHPEARMSEARREQLIRGIKHYMKGLHQGLLEEQFSGNDLHVTTAKGDTTIVFEGPGEQRVIELFTSPLLSTVQEVQGSAPLVRLYFAESAHDEKAAITPPAQSIYGAYMSNRPAGILYCLHRGSLHQLIFKDLSTFQDHQLYSSTDSIQHYAFLSGTSAH